MAEFTPAGRDDYGDLTDPFVLKGVLASIEAEIRASYGGGIVILTETEYGAIETPDPDILYVVTPD